MRLTTILSSALLILLPGVIVPASAQEHEQQKQPEQKQEKTKPAPSQKQEKPAKRTQQAQRPKKAKPTQPPQQRAARQQKAAPARTQQRGQEQQRAGRSEPAAGHGSIPEARFRASFGSSHTFHVNRAAFGSGRFQYGGYWFNAAGAWPVGWLYTDNVYVDYLNGGYFLCNPLHPGVYISINIG